MILKDIAAITLGATVIQTPDRITHRYDIQHIEKYQGLDYEAMSDRVAAIMGHIDLCNNSDLLVDGTGVGEAAVELIRKRGCYPIPIIFTGGETYHEVYTPAGHVFRDIAGRLQGAHVLKEIHVPKKDLTAAGALLLQQGRIAVAPSRWREEFVKQLSLFKGKVNERTNRTKYEAESETIHDDLVVCYLMAAWWILHRHDREALPEQVIGANDCIAYEPDEYM
jgi:hypothetical protein